VRYVFDALFWVLFAGIYLFVAVMTGMPSLRFFTFLGCIGGLFLYLKSFHKIVAFFAERVYNGISQVVKRKLYARAERRKIAVTQKKTHRRTRGSGDDAALVSRHHSHHSIRKNGRRQRRTPAAR